MVTAVRQRGRDLGVGADGADHGGAQRARPLRQDHAHAAGRGVDQHRVAGLDHVQAPQQVLGRQAAQQRGTGDLLGDVVG